MTSTSQPAVSLPSNPARLRSYILRLPLFTRLVLVVILAFWVLELQTVWSVVDWGALIPNEIGLGGSRFLDSVVVMRYRLRGSGLGLGC